MKFKSIGRKESPSGKRTPKRRSKGGDERETSRGRSHLITIPIVVRIAEHERSSLEIELKSYVCICSLTLKSRPARASF